MAMVRWDPFGEMMAVQRDMNRLFSSLGMPLYTERGDGERVAWMPTVDVIREQDRLVVHAELPGVKPQDVDVSVTDDTLTIKGKREEREEHKQGEYIRKESTFGTFERQIMLPQGVNAGDIKADYHDGVLEVIVPIQAKPATEKTQHIPVSGQGRTAMQGSGGGSAQAPSGGPGQGI